jgi:hypothetical protein
VGDSGERRAFDDARQVGLGKAELREIEEGVLGLVVSERVDLGDEVAELTVRVDEVVDAGDRLRRLLFVRQYANPRRGLGKCGAVAGAPGFDTIEKDLPLGRHRRWVALPLLVEIAYVLRVGAVQEIEARHGDIGSPGAAGLLYHSIRSLPARRSLRRSAGNCDHFTATI